MFHLLSSLPAFAPAFAHDPGVDSLIFALNASPLRLLWTGYEAVILFFVLSGFVLTLQLEPQNGRSSAPRYLRYLIRRLTRLYLPYALVMSVAVVLCALLGGSSIAELSDWFNMEWS